MIVLFLSLSSYSQTDKQKKRQRKYPDRKTHFGIIYSPVIPSNFLQKNDITKTTDTSQYNVNQAMSYYFGMEIRHDFTKRFAIQTGINFIRRNWDVKADFEGELFQERLKFNAYELPFSVLGYVQLGQNVFMNISGGASFEMYPSDIYFKRFFAKRKFWILPSLNANLGWEYRDKKNGIFYLGASYKIVSDEFLLFVFTSNSSYPIDEFRIPGNFFSINLKYYFPQNK